MFSKHTHGDLDSPSEKHLDVLEQLKARMVAEPIMAVHKCARPYMVDCGAGTYGVGAVRLQEQDEEN